MHFIAKFFVLSEKSCTFALNMISHASCYTSGPGEVFEFFGKLLFPVSVLAGPIATLKKVKDNAPQ